MSNINKYHLVTVRPNIDTLGNVAFSADDILFDWTAFEVPRGGCAIRSLNIIMAGTNSAVANGALQMDLYFATSLNGVAPPSLGLTNSAPTLIATTACRNHIIAYNAVLGSEMEDSLDGLIGYNVLGKGAVTSATTMQSEQLTVLKGDPSYVGDAVTTATTTGYQTIWIAGLAQGAYDFGTDVKLVGNATDLTTRGFNVTDDTDGDDVFGISDELIAFAADGSSGQVIGSVTAVTNNLVTTDGVGFDGALADDDEISFRGPMIIKIGLEY